MHNSLKLDKFSGWNDKANAISRFIYDKRTDSCTDRQFKPFPNVTWNDVV